jgi:hypothetical protein
VDSRVVLGRRRRLTKECHQRVIAVRLVVVFQIRHVILARHLDVGTHCFLGQLLPMRRH